MTLIAFGDRMLHASLPNLASRRHCGPTAARGMPLSLQPCGFSTTIAPCLCRVPASPRRQDGLPRGLYLTNTFYDSLRFFAGRPPRWPCRPGL